MKALKPIKAYDGEDAYQKFSEHSPDCMVIDIMMPKMDGLELVESSARVSSSDYFC